jgi:hypothetical protein
MLGEADISGPTREILAGSDVEDRHLRSGRRPPQPHTRQYARHPSAELR